ncbi:uncharacterized protein [Nerophis lumbriciformis]|uniref:uncharacterized protein n=1 Tax=Nerophis lumbriciformis TaxID=546530 RepID=UPI003BAB0B44
MARMCGYTATLKADAFPTIKSKKSAARPPLNLPECVSNSGTKDLGSTASNGGSLFLQTSELNHLDVLAHTVPYATEDDQEKNIDPSFPGLLTSTPKLDRSAFRKKERKRVLQDIFSNSYRHSLFSEEDDCQTLSRADIGVQMYSDVKSKDIHQLIGHQEECLPHLQGDSFTSEDPQPSHLKGNEKDPKPPYFKEEEEGECSVGQEEDDVSKFPLTVVSVKTEEHEDKAPESSQLHHSPNVQQPLHIKEEEDDPQPTYIKEEEEDPQPTHIKEEEEDPHRKEEEEGECVVGQEEDDVSKFPLTVVSVKTEEHEDKAPESSQLHHSPSKHISFYSQGIQSITTGLFTLS